MMFTDKEIIAMSAAPVVGIDPTMEVDACFMNVICPVCGNTHEANEVVSICDECLSKERHTFVIFDAVYQLAECKIIENEHVYKLTGSSDWLSEDEFEWIGKPVPTGGNNKLSQIAFAFEEFCWTYKCHNINIKAEAKAAFAEFLESYLPF